MISRELFFLLVTPAAFGLVLTLSSIPLFFLALLRKRRWMAGLGMRTGFGGLALIMLGSGLLEIAISIPLSIALLASGRWLELLFMPIIWLFGVGFLAGGVKVLQWAVRRDRDPLTQWGTGSKVPDDWT